MSIVTTQPEMLTPVWTSDVSTGLDPVGAHRVRRLLPSEGFYSLYSAGPACRGPKMPAPVVDSLDPVADGRL
jgi:hypothetical protein